MDKQGNFSVGLMWGASLSVPLWLAFFGWVKIILSFL
jgi:hypothetical protein